MSTLKRIWISFLYSRRWEFSLCTTAVLLCVFIFNPFRLKTFQRAVSDSIDAITDAKTLIDDPRVLRYIKDAILEPPSVNLKHSYNFNETFLASEEFYNRNLFSIFSETASGFFVEAGALNGEDMSNTLWLEAERGWTGLLIEPDLDAFRALRTANRKSWSANSCLSVEKHPKMEAFSFESTLTANYKGMSFLKRAVNSRLLPPSLQASEEGTTSYNMTCFPLGSFLLAMEVTKVDLLSLDVEHCEDKILQNFDFDRFDIQVIFIEWITLVDSDLLIAFLEERSYILVDNIQSDFIFVKKGTLYHEIVIKKINSTFQTV